MILPIVSIVDERRAARLSKWRVLSAFEMRILERFWFRQRAGRKGEQLLVSYACGISTESLCRALSGTRNKRRRERKERFLKTRLHLHFSTLRCGRQGRRVMQILICLTGKLVKFSCFSAINPQITYTLPFALVSPHFASKRFAYEDPRDRSGSFSGCAKLMTSASRGRKKH